MTNWTTFVLIIILLLAAFYTSIRLLLLSKRVNNGLRPLDNVISVVLFILGVITLGYEFIRNKKPNGEEEGFHVANVSDSDRTRPISEFYDVIEAQQVDVPPIEADSVEAYPNSVGPARILSIHS